ncbi:deoxynucleoside kinase [Aquisalimonas sp. 2447]|uniref:deoxynucleoside kinase n=1 Tax=Aquisalimonas sp. 2447 TaxID=2740807 RepID=UPI0014324045|nr:deoxynucleoside kinase [Aquisalimonas sp. 2447]QIT56024.1 deoxynucleoside kinase [Aquisalimonas sp. 2447]
MAEHNDPAYVVVEGPIGVGKTTLARRLAGSFGSELLLEGAEDNPFLERFYENPRDAAFATQMHFLMQRAEQLRGLRQADLFETTRIADFLFEKDRLFAQLTLTPEEFELYERVYNHLAPEVQPPDLVIYLQAPVSVLMERVRKRGIEAEQRIDAEYLQRLSDAYVEFFHHYDRAPLLIVNAAEIDLVSNDGDYWQLLERLRTIRSGRHFFNPAPIA